MTLSSTDYVVACVREARTHTDAADAHKRTDNFYGLVTNFQYKQWVITERVRDVRAEAPNYSNYF